MSQLSTERVTAGLPSLSPSVRFQNDTRILRHEKQKSIHAEMDRRRDEAVAPDGERSRTEKSACVGVALHSSELMRRLTVLNPGLWFQRHPSLPVMQLWIRDEAKGKRFICGFEAEYSPEFEVILWHQEEHVEGYGPDAKLVKVKVADDTIRGWRTVLITLMRQKLITRAGVERLFGVKANSRWWQKRAQGY